MRSPRPSPLALLLWVVLAATCAPPFAPPAAAEGKAGLASGERVVFFGDGVTQQRLYSRYVAQFVAVRYPDRDVRFFNAGWEEDTAKAGLERLERDVLPLSPTVVTVCFGHSDAIAKPVDVTGYREALVAIVKALRAKNVRVVLMTPGCVDPDRGNAKVSLSLVQDAMGELAKTALDVAKETGVAGVDLHHAMLSFQTEAKAADAGFTMFPDGTRPDETAHLVIARAVLEALGAEAMPVLGELESKAAAGKGIKVASWDDAGPIVLETTAPLAASFWYADSAARVMETSGFLDTLAGQRLVVGDLPAGDWEVVVDDGAPFRATAATLSRGLLISGLGSDAAKTVHDLVELKENAHAGLWRNVRTKLRARPDGAKPVQDLLAVDQGFATAILSAAAPRAPGVRIVLMRPPAGENLARGRPATASDPSPWGAAWGTAALTDGFWDRNHCFATGFATTFPKSVVVDLQRMHRIAVVRIGAPDFGATKTVAVGIGSDGKKFKEVGQVEFTKDRNERRTLTFAPVAGRYVRLEYKDHQPAPRAWEASVLYTTEVEVYGPAK